jgi:hypothetical protein
MVELDVNCVHATGCISEGARIVGRVEDVEGGVV